MISHFINNASLINVRTVELKSGLNFFLWLPSMTNPKRQKFIDYWIICIVTYQRDVVMNIHNMIIYENIYDNKYPIKVI